MEALRLHVTVPPGASPGAYELKFYDGGFFLAYDRRLPQDRPDGLSWRNGTVFVTEETPLFLRGDVNQDGRADISDAVRGLGILFLGEAPTPCPQALDSNDDGRLDVSDSIYELDWLYLGGQSPPPPGPAGCGPDPTPDELGLCFYDPAGC